MSVKVGNIVTDEGSVREVLSVDDAENLISTMSTSSSDVATNGSVAVATFGGWKGRCLFYRRYLLLSSPRYLRRYRR